MTANDDDDPEDRGDSRSTTSRPSTMTGRSTANRSQRPNESPDPATSATSDRNDASGAETGLEGDGRLTPVASTLGPTFEMARLASGRPLRLVLLVSGGLDSVALLVNLLASTDHEVHAHHIVLDNLERRADAESQALEAVRAWVDQHTRACEWSTSTHSFHVPGGAGGYDTTLCMFTASRVVRALWRWRVDAVVTGHIHPGFAELSEGEAVFHAGFQSRRSRPAWVRPLSRLRGTPAEHKALIRNSTPPEVVELCWWCRRPVVEGAGWRPCGTCHACRAMDHAAAIDRAAAPAAHADGG